MDNPAQPLATPYAPLNQAGVTIEGLDIGRVVNTIHDQGYAIVEDFLSQDDVSSIRHAFNTEVPITALNGLGAIGRSWRAHNP